MLNNKLYICGMIKLVDPSVAAIAEVWRGMRLDKSFTL